MTVQDLIALLQKEYPEAQVAILSDPADYPRVLKQVEADGIVLDDGKEIDAVMLIAGTRYDMLNT